LSAVPLVTGADEFALVRDFAITLAVAGAALVLFRLVKQPPVLGYLVAGVIVGPFTLPTPLVRDLDVIRLLADLGLVLLLFGIGLELGWQRIRQVGTRVMVIAVVEMTIMFAAGYETGYLLGWSVLESVFLGAALCISSSAILVKMLRDSGELFSTRGRLIVGILVVEDFAAVILLTVLSGVGQTGSTDPAAVGLLVGKLIIFGIAALVFGAIVAPRLIHFVNRYHSDETLLITSLALCFGLALAGQQLGLSAAAGAFLIGTVLGDTEHSEDISRVMNPVKDMFAALFFVSIGMLMDVRLFPEFFIPALIISAVFMVGKVVADTLGTFLTGYDGRTSLSVGMGMPQLGEFSLAISRVGVAGGTVGSFINPVITIATAVTTLFYPWVFRGAGAAADLINQRSPGLLKEYFGYLFIGVAALGSAFRFQNPQAQRIQRSVRLIALNLGIVILVIAIGTGLLQFNEGLATVAHLSDSLWGLTVTGAVLGFCAPSILAMWRSLRRLTDSIADYIAPGVPRSTRMLMRVILRNSFLIMLLILPIIWSGPFLSRLFSLGTFSLPVAVLLLAGAALALGLAGFRIHRELEASFSMTFLGVNDPHQEDDDPTLPSGDNLDPERSSD
jgi:CPA2 family monovalent cation:H+ antiporter-2